MFLGATSIDLHVNLITIIMHILLLLLLLLLSQATYGILKIQKYCTEERYDTLMKIATEWWKLLWNPSECIKNVLKTVKVARECWSIKSSKKNLEY